MRIASRYQQTTDENRIEPKHGEEVDVSGTPCLWLDSGTRKGVWLSPRKAACVLANADKIRIFLAKYPEKKPEPVMASTATGVDQTKLEVDNAALKKELENIKAVLALRNANPVNNVTAIERFNPVG